MPKKAAAGLFRAAGWRHLAWVAIVVLAAGCAGKPPREIPAGADFSAEILADNTKLFTYSVRLERPQGRAAGMQRGRSLDDEPQPRPRQSDRRQGLEAALAENGYCREGFLLLEQYERSDRYVMRGECRDAATDADRARFHR